MNRRDLLKTLAILPMAGMGMVQGEESSAIRAAIDGSQQAILAIDDAMQCEARAVMSLNT